MRMDASKDAEFGWVVDRMVKTHGCHAVLLYGSRARGDADADSDYDVLGLSQDLTLRDATRVDGKYLDAFVKPASDAVASPAELLRIRGGKILVDGGGDARKLLEAVEGAYREGPSTLPEDEVIATRSWVLKMLERAKRGDIEGNFRRAWLQRDLLEVYFQLRGRWYLGPKESFTWLRANDHESLVLFEAALRRDAGDAMIEALAKRVIETTLG